MKPTSSRITAVVTVMSFLFILGFFLWGRETPLAPARIAQPYDWSHHHVVFSNPATLEQSLRIRQDPRYWHQWYRRKARQAIPVAGPAFDESRERNEDWRWLNGDWFGWFGRRHHRPEPRNPLKRDWAISLGPNATVGAGNFPAKYSFDINSANCGDAAQPDFVVFNTSVATSSQASIVAYDNLYGGCATGAVPSNYWAYNTGGSVVTSVTLSYDGSQVAFIQTSASVASLVLLKWTATTDGATSTHPDSPANVSASQYATCTAPCMTTLAFSGAANDTNSSPFCDYAGDALYVGDDSGSLHKFHPVFGAGTPAEVGSPWPISLASGLQLSSPVLDSVSGNVFVGSGFNGSSGTQLFGVNSSTGAITGTSSSLGRGNGIVAGPIVDSSVGQVYAFVGTDNGTSTCFSSGTSCSAVYQFPVTFSTGTGIKTVVSSQGNMGAVFTLYGGTFDDAYYRSPNGTGQLYVCGNTRGVATLVRVSITAGVMSGFGDFGRQLSGPLGSNGNIPCSPLSEISNPNLNSGINSGGPQGTDTMFLSTQGSATVSPCFTGNGGCMFAASVTEWQPGTAYTLGQVIADTNMRTQVVTKAGTSGGTPPTWQFTAGVSTTDGSVTWTTKASVGTTAVASNWTSDSFYSAGILILDSNGNLEATTVNSGETGPAQPIWPSTIGTTTMDGTQIWINVGPFESFGLPVLGGTSGIVVDNVVPMGTLAGGSQIYFSPLTLGFSTCGTGNGCAMQASQAGLN